MHEGEFGLSRFGSEPTINAIGNVEANATLRVKVEIVQRKQLNDCGDCISPILDVIGRERQLAENAVSQELATVYSRKCARSAGALTCFRLGIRSSVDYQPTSVIPQQLEKLLPQQEISFLGLVLDLRLFQDGEQPVQRRRTIFQFAQKGARFLRL
jgi:hypothetical protein